MNHKQIPQFFKHTIDTGIYESKICPLGNAAAFALAGWIYFRDVVTKNSLRRPGQLVQPSLATSG